MPASKIVDEQEVIRWFRDGLTYPQMIEMYRHLYNIETSPTMWAMFRKRRGLPMRQGRNSALVPWVVQPRHRWSQPLPYLRMEARRREGLPVSEADEVALDAFLARLDSERLVVEYRPDTDEGFHLVPRRDGERIARS